MSKEKLEVFSGALILMSDVPISGAHERGFKDIWVPSITIATPRKGKPLIVDEFSIREKGTPYYIKNKTGQGVWYTNEKIEKSLKSYRLYLYPGVGEPELPIIYTYENAFMPDKKDKNKERRNIYLVLVRSNGFHYAERDRYFTAHVRKEDVFRIIYTCLLHPRANSFGYDCEIDGIGMMPNLHGKADIPLDQRQETVNILRRRLEELL